MKLAPGPSRFFLFFLTLVGSCNGHAPLIIREGRARAGQIPQPRRDVQSLIPTAPSTQIKGEHIYIWGGGNDGDTDWALALAIYFLSFFMNVSVALARGR
jgi:hypothetical protein